jgi:hypothetical protein
MMAFPFNLTDGTGAIALILDPADQPMGCYSRTRLASGQVTIPAP